MGIEPIFAAWKADHLPLMHTRFILYEFSGQCESNTRPPVPKTDALSHCAMPRYII